MKMAAAVRQHEPDCLVYRPHRSTAEPTVFYFYEQYRTDAAASSFTGPRRTSPGYRAEMKELVARPSESRAATARSRPDGQAGAAARAGAERLRDRPRHERRSARQRRRPARMNPA